MTVHVNLQIYTDAANSLTKIGTGLETAIDKLWKALQKTDGMAGTSDAAKKWATSYDSRAASVLDNAHKLAQTLPYFASLIATAGYNHAISDYNSTNPPQGTAPTPPPTVDQPVPLCWTPPPSAGGPGNGLVSISQLMQYIHVHIPDGDTDKLTKAHDAWYGFNQDTIVSNIHSDIQKIIDSFKTVQSPEIEDLMEGLSRLADAGWKLCGGSNQLLSECASHKNALKDLRDRIDRAVRQLDEMLAGQLAVTILAAVVTAGAGLALSGADAALSADEVIATAGRVTEAVAAVDVDSLMTTAAGTEDSLADVGGSLDKLGALTRTEIEAEVDGTSTAGSLLPKLTAEDEAVINKYTLADKTSPTGYYQLNAALRGGTLDADQAAMTSDLNAALSKLPDHSGVVFRGTDLPQSAIDNYVEGQVVTEKQFFSTSSDPNKSFPGNTQFEVISLTGKEISPYSSFPEDEVLFRSNTNFYVASNVTDPVTGITHIKLIER
ncbi:ADP-ribosyltransferase [Nocardia stercoris]|uniref:NAD(+)--protein-arginine ADP-ribosyltransferase n=1 Tax=Nocardia stercoris TaxID=2483361 RepID=A0A3M2KX64_9NOCA|nr:ADP-ribosyltransferase [Nocardia stercoris]RMI29851.1 hypothetical protein EBN03_23940 [Nocardia stercoris]